MEEQINRPTFGIKINNNVQQIIFFSNMLCFNYGL